MTTNLVVLQSTNPLNLHHTVLKAATARGFFFVGTDNHKFRIALIDNPQMLSAETFDSPAEAREAFDAGEVKFETPQQDKTSTTGRCGIMATVYHARYSSNPDGPGNGDELDVALRSCMTVTNEHGKPEISLGAMEATGILNNVWNPEWLVLNRGLIRMNLANRLRALLRNKHDTVSICADDGEVAAAGRFGIEFKGKAPKAAKTAKEV